ncbi:NUDIX domain-containing protein [Herbiconiux sp. SYSU D00978]|uniref:NUDIX domain-containing protein n=1 Tax=Herbiconiux sp. SYSU D00978 TaxID=2812562 RepID=UPI001A968C97|nr:NUDIX hydrolase [Herbiconiux sp. SYSU D00978]
MPESTAPGHATPGHSTPDERELATLADLRDEPFEPTVLSREKVFEGRVWDVVSEDFEYNGQTITRDFVDHTGAVIVLAIDDDDRVLLIQQYRHPIRERDWELPAGLLDVQGEDPMDAARRELAEEADLEAETLEPLIEYHSTSGGSNELIRIYLARGLTPTEQFERVDEEADIVKRWAALDDVVAAALAGRLRNSGLLMGALAAHASRDRWSTKTA